MFHGERLDVVSDDGIVHTVIVSSVLEGQAIEAGDIVFICLFVEQVCVCVRLNEHGPHKFRFVRFGGEFQDWFLPDWERMAANEKDQNRKKPHHQGR